MKLSELEIDNIIILLHLLEVLSAIDLILLLMSDFRDTVLDFILHLWPILNLHY